MNNLPEGRRGQVLAVAIALVALTFVYLVVVGPILGLYADGSDELQRKHEMADRLRASSRALPRLRAEVEGLKDPAKNNAVLLTGATAPVAAAQLQSSLKELVESGGARLTSAEVLNPEPADSYQKIGLHVSVTGNVALLATLLRGIETGRQAMFVDNVEIHSGSNQGSDSQVLEIAFDVYGFRSL